MGLTNQERINLNSKVLAAKVFDNNSSAQWYESKLLYSPTVIPGKYLLEYDIILENSAASLTDARNNVSGPLSGVVQDYSQDVDARQLTVVAGTNNTTWVALETPGDFSSNRLENWIQPQSVAQSNGNASIGYAIALYDGDPNAGGTLVTTTEGQTGSGDEASVGWVFNYDMGILLLSDDFKSSISNPYIKGFQYIGSTGPTVATETGNTFSDFKIITSSDEENGDGYIELNDNSPFAYTVATSDYGSQYISTYFGVNAGTFNYYDNGANTGFGNEAIANLREGGSNLSGNSEGGGFGHVGVGYGAMRNVEGGLYSIGIGYEALANAQYITGFTGYETAIGVEAMKNYQNASAAGRNVALGAYVMQNFGSEYDPTYINDFNVAIGNQAMQHANSVENSFAIGAFCMQNLSGANQNFALGFFAMQNASDSYKNIAIGTSTMRNAVPRDQGDLDGDKNIALGDRAGEALSGSANVYIGGYAGAVNDGDRNIFVGKNAGLNTVYASDTILLGDNNDANSGITKSIAMGDNLTVVQSNSIIFNNDMSMGLGTNAPQAQLHVTGDVLSNSSVSAQTFYSGSTDISDLFAGLGTTLDPHTNVLYVNNNGVTTGAEIGNINRPYQTIESAATDANASDLIYILPGYYTPSTSITGTSATTIYGLPGVTINPSGRFIVDSSGYTNASIYGEIDFILTGSGKVFYSDNSDTDYYLECKRARTGNAADGKGHVFRNAVASTASGVTVTVKGVNLEVYNGMLNDVALRLNDCTANVIDCTFVHNYGRVVDARGIAGGDGTVLNMIRSTFVDEFAGSDGIIVMGAFSNSSSTFELNMEDSRVYLPNGAGTKELLELNNMLDLNFRGTNIIASNPTGATTPSMTLDSTVADIDINIIGSLYTTNDINLDGSVTGYTVNVGNLIIDDKVSVNY